MELLAFMQIFFVLMYRSIFNFSHFKTSFLFKEKMFDYIYLKDTVMRYFYILFIWDLAF